MASRATQTFTDITAGAFAHPRQNLELPCTSVPYLVPCGVFDQKIHGMVNECR